MLSPLQLLDDEAHCFGNFSHPVLNLRGLRRWLQLQRWQQRRWQPWG
jgi:hypothetical protein